jgi:hypothetical protein
LVSSKNNGRLVNEFYSLILTPFPQSLCLFRIFKVTPLVQQTPFFEQILIFPVCPLPSDYIPDPFHIARHVFPDEFKYEVSPQIQFILVRNRNTVFTLEIIFKAFYVFYAFYVFLISPFNYLTI